mmetsp:Transcript_25909/g.70240  ORF Transcript_25909/g.70240 Transcript_25909/m.70240 type:complete len:268 (-) Transcript_25909:357-1160(-)
MPCCHHSCKHVCLPALAHSSHGFPARCCCLFLLPPTVHHEAQQALGVFSSPHRQQLAPHNTRPCCPRPLLQCSTLEPGITHTPHPVHLPACNQRILGDASPAKQGHGQQARISVAAHRLRPAAQHSSMARVGCPHCHGSCHAYCRGAHHNGGYRGSCGVRIAHVVLQGRKADAQPPCCMPTAGTPLTSSMYPLHQHRLQPGIQGQLQAQGGHLLDCTHSKGGQRPPACHVVHPLPQHCPELALLQLCSTCLCCLPCEGQAGHHITPR